MSKRSGAREVLQAVLDVGTPWTDPDFPPCASSLFHDWSSVPSQELWSKFRWRRSTEFYGKTGPTDLSGKIVPDDISQGALGDCYLLGSLSVLAEVHSRVEDLFLTKEYNDAGVYAVRLLWKGAWQTVLLDNYFPYYADIKRPAFAHCKDSPELWVMLIEKAFAKLNGSYQAIIAGSPAEALRMLTGAPTERFEPDDETVFERLCKGEKCGWPMMASTSTSKDIDAEKLVGLVEGHAYAILNAKLVTTDDGKRHRLIQMRNPWGKVEWTGDWSDSSPLWNGRLRSELNWSGQDNGIFWISMDDVIPYLQAFYINHWQSLASGQIAFRCRLAFASKVRTFPTIQPGWSFSSITTDLAVEEDSLPMGAFMIVKEAESSGPWTDLWITLHCLTDSIDWPAVQMSMLKSGEDGIYRPFAESKYLQYYKVQKDLDCLPGEYLLYLRVIPPKRLSTSQSQVVVDTYSEQPVDLTFLPFAEMWQRIQPSLSTLTIENGKTETYQEWSAPLVSVTRWQSSAIGVSCIIYENQPGSSVSLHEEVVLQLNNLELLDANGEEGVPSDAQVAIAIDLAPGESRMLVFRQIDNGYSFSLGYSRSFSLRDHC